MAGRVRGGSAMMVASPLLDRGNMPIKERIVADLTAAMKAKDAPRLGVIRMLKSRIMEAEVEQRGRKGAGYVLEDEECLAAIAA